MRASQSGAIRFSAVLLRPRREDAPRKGSASRAAPRPQGRAWSFLTLPTAASNRLPSRGMVSVRGDLNGATFEATLEPDGGGGHWLKVHRKLMKSANVGPGDHVSVEITPVTADDEPEPMVPADLKKALAAAPPETRGAWSDITPIARRDWVQWITSGKKAETRASRIAKACDMLANGKRRPCCFDRSGMYGKSLCAPRAAPPDEA